MRIGSSTDLGRAPALKHEATSPNSLSATSRIQRASWSLFRRQPQPALRVLNTLKGEHYSLHGLTSAAERQTVASDHFLNFDAYQSRDFVICEGRDIAMTMNAKGIAAPGHGFIEEFNVGGVRGLPRPLLGRDLKERETGWWAKAGDIERVAGCSIPLCHFGYRTFGHFVLDALLQIYIFRDSLNAGDAKVAHWRLPLAWMRDLLDRCGVQRGARVQLSKPVALFQTVGLSSALAGHGVYFPSSLSVAFIDWLRTTFDVPKSLGERRLYIRRQNEYGRAIYNERDLAELAERYGFELISPEDIPVSDQMRLFSEAGVVLSPWGSGLTFAPLLSGPRSVIELLPSSVTDPWFARQAIVHALDYHPLVHPSDPIGNMTVDLERVEKALSSLP